MAAIERSHEPMSESPRSNRSSGSGRADPDPKKGRRRMTPKEQLRIAERVKKGERASDIARELGYSRQRIAVIVKKYESEGAEGFKNVRPHGRPSGVVPLDVIQGLIKMLRDETPAEHGFGKKDAWTFEKAEVAGIPVLGRKPPKTYLRKAFEIAGVPLTHDPSFEEEVFSKEFKAYVNSPLAQQIREREAEYHKRLEAEGLIGRPKKMGRPTKAETARRSEPWKFAGEKKGDGHEPTDTSREEIPDWYDLTPKQKEEWRAKIAALDIASAGRAPDNSARVWAGRAWRF